MREVISTKNQLGRPLLANVRAEHDLNGHLSHPSEIVIIRAGSIKCTLVATNNMLVS
jgi:hypothetical protein